VTGSSPSVVAFTLNGGRIVEIDIVRNPAKLRRDLAHRPDRRRR